MSIYEKFDLNLRSSVWLFSIFSISDVQSIGPIKIELYKHIKIARGWKLKKDENKYYPCSENNGVDQLHRYCEADLRLCFRIDYA